MSKQRPERPRRTREHIIASQSLNYIEKFFIDKGHTVDRPGSDYGYDLVVNTFDPEGYAESGDVRIQLKASHEFAYVHGGKFISFAVSTKHYALWSVEPMPVFLVLYDANEARAFWLDIQEYFRADPSLRPKPDAKTLTLRVPVRNVFTEATVDLIRDRKSAVVARYRRMVEHGG